MQTKSQVTSDETLKHHRVVSSEEWINERKKLLAKEKEITRLSDALSEERRNLPWVKIEKTYVFDGPNGKETLADLFEGRSQLIVKHFMFGPGWKEGCVGCSFGADHIDGANMHLRHHDVSVVAVSRAPLAEIEPFRQRMGWNFKWVSAYETDFNYDFHVSATKAELENGEIYYNYKMQPAHGDEMSGLSVFYKDEEGNIYHTYSTFGRGDEKVLGTYMLLDLTPKGRNENGPHFSLGDWVRHHDKYDSGGYVDATGRYVAEKKNDSCCGHEEH